MVRVWAIGDDPQRKNDYPTHHPAASPLSTDPGTGFVITDMDGKRDNSRWASMRGMPVRGTTMPGESTTWLMTSGVTLLSRELAENPWR